MPFNCPECRNKSLEIIKSIELPSDSRSDEITLQVVQCRSCSFTGIAVYEESRRGVLGSEVFDHTGYRVKKTEVKRLRSAINACPHPRDSHCGCAAHQKLGSQDTSGRWNGLSGIDLQDAFEMVL